MPWITLGEWMRRHRERAKAKRFESGFAYAMTQYWLHRYPTYAMWDELDGDSLVAGGSDFDDGVKHALRMLPDTLPPEKIITGHESRYHPAVLAAHAEFGGNLDSMQRYYDAIPPLDRPEPKPIPVASRVQQAKERPIGKQPPPPKK